jgi:hypothetical protein
MPRSTAVAGRSHLRCVAATFPPNDVSPAGKRRPPAGRADRQAPACPPSRRAAHGRVRAAGSISARRCEHWTLNRREPLVVAGREGKGPMQCFGACGPRAAPTNPPRPTRVQLSIRRILKKKKAIDPSSSIELSEDCTVVSSDKERSIRLLCSGACFLFSILRVCAGSRSRREAAITSFAWEIWGIGIGMGGRHCLLRVTFGQRSTPPPQKACSITFHQYAQITRKRRI